MLDIWDEYKRRYPDEILDIDGIVNEAIYRNEKNKVLFVLKETNDLNGSLCEFLNHGAPGNGRKTWQPCCKWAGVLIDEDKKAYSTSDERKGTLQRIAAINLKKISGTATSSNDYINWAKEHIDLLKKQFDEINPDIIVLCCNNEGNKFICENILALSKREWTEDKELTSFKATTWNGKLIIWARHPLFAQNQWTEAFRRAHQKYVAD